MKERRRERERDGKKKEFDPKQTVQASVQLPFLPNAFTASAPFD